MDSGLAASRRPGMTPWVGPALPKSDSIIKQPDADVHHRPGQSGCRATLQFNVTHDTPKDGSSAPRGRLWPLSALSRRGPASSVDLAADRRSAHRAGTIRGSFSEIRILPTRRGRTDATCSVVCATKLARWGSSGATPAFRLSPALAGLRLLLRLYLIGR